MGLLEEQPSFSIRRRTSPRRGAGSTPTTGTVYTSASAKVGPRRSSTRSATGRRARPPRGQGLRRRQALVQQQRPATRTQPSLQVMITEVGNAHACPPPNFDPQEAGRIFARSSPRGRTSCIKRRRLRPNRTLRLPPPLRSLWPRGTGSLDSTTACTLTKTARPYRHHHALHLQARSARRNVQRRRLPSR